MPRSSEHEGVGRLPSYCSTGCRRAAEHEIRRAQKSHRDDRGSGAGASGNLAVWPQYGMHRCGQGQAKQRHLDWLEGERELLEARMRLLLEDGEATP
jgi:hypothetical protein